MFFLCAGCTERVKDDTVLCAVCHRQLAQKLESEKQRADLNFKNAEEWHQHWVSIAAERDHYKSQIDGLKADISGRSAISLGLQHENEVMQLQVDDLRRKLLAYGGHLEVCVRRRTLCPEEACDCGFWKIKQEAKGTENRLVVCPWEALKGGEKCTFPKGHGGLHSFHGDIENRFKDAIASANEQYGPVFERLAQDTGTANPAGNIEKRKSEYKWQDADLRDGENPCGCVVKEEGVYPCLSHSGRRES